MDALGRFWAQVTATTPDLRSGVLLGTAAVAAVLVLSPALWRPTRHVVTIAHEGAHGLVALAAGRRLSGIRLHSDTSGLTVSAGRPTGLGMVLTCAAGYVGPGLFGLGAAALLAGGYAVGLPLDRVRPEVSECSRIPDSRRPAARATTPCAPSWAMVTALRVIRHSAGERTRSAATAPAASSSRGVSGGPAVVTRAQKRPTTSR